MNELDIFSAALDLADSPARARYLDEACAGDPNLRSRIDALLRNASDASRYLESSPQALLATIDQPAAAERIGAQIGPYKLLEQIGEGGMGLVYMAEQQHPVRRLVALKIIKPGMDSKQVIARFEAERQALAMMDHPNIAKVFDAGTTETGRPYFVMELVRGIPLNEFFAQKRLTVRERLQLFLQVCQAVQHAHQKGIIHRDLKPTNVLVTMADTVAFPKLLDFGIAKALGQSLTDHTLHTGYSQLVGTPLYMSPEQAEMNLFGVDIRSDVYSLGVLLYELLTGTTPIGKDRLKSATFDEMRRIIREEEPETVSARLAKTRSRHTPCAVNPKSKIQNPKSFTELDWIVMKALEKDRSRRYESASALAADIQRYLSDEPVLACPPTTMYRFQKFARKHRPALVTAAATALCLILGTTVSAWQAVRATNAQAQANDSEKKAVANEQKAFASAAAAEQKEQEAIKQRDEVKALADKLAAKEEELERTMYADHIYMAKEAWDSGNVTRVTRLLNQHLPKPGETDRRGFEWHYLNRLSQLGPLFSINTGAGVYGARNPALSSDRTRLLRFIRSQDMRRGPGAGPILERKAVEPTVKVWDLQTGEQEFTATLSGAAGAGAFSPDGTRLVTGTGSLGVNVFGDLKVWDTKTGKEIGAHTGAIADVVFSANSQLLASAWKDATLKVVDLRTGQERWTLKGHRYTGQGFVISADGGRLASASNSWDKSKNANVNDIKVWDLQTGEELWTASGITEWLSTLVFSPDGLHLVSVHEGTVKLWKAQTGEAGRTFQFDIEDGWQFEFSPDGTRLIGTGDKEEQQDYVDYSKMWNVQTGQELLSLKNCWLSFSPDGKKVAAEDSQKSRTKVFDAANGQQFLNVPGNSPTFSPDSKRLAVRSSGLHIWDLQTGDEINHLKGNSSGSGTLAFSLDGRRLIRYGGIQTDVWDVEARQVSAKKVTFHGLNRNFGSNGPSPAVFSSDFKRVVGISYSKIKIYDAQSGQEQRTLPGHDNSVVCVAISSDGKRVASSDGQGSLSANEKPGVVKVWDADSGSELFTIKGHERSISFLAFSPDGAKLAGFASDRTVKIWDAQSGRELHNLGTKSAMISSIFRLVFSPDSKRLVAAGKIWDVETGQELVTPKGLGLGAAQSAIAFTPNGKLFAGGVGTTVANAQTGEALFSLPRGDAMAGSPWLAFSPDGKRLASAAGIWDAHTGQELLSFGDRRAGGSGQVIFSPDGHRLAVVPFNGNEVTIYDATPLPEKP